MRQYAPGELHWKSRVIADPYSNVDEGIITNVYEEKGYVDVRLLQRLGSIIRARLSFQSIGKFCNARVMPCVGDMVLIGYGHKNVANIIGYISPSEVKPMTGVSGVKDTPKEGKGGYQQLVEASKAGEEWEIIRGGGSSTNTYKWKRPVIFRKIRQGEFDLRSGSPEQIGGAEVYGDVTGTLHLMGGPAVMIKLVMDANENQQYSDLFKRQDNSISTNSCGIEERFGTVKRKPTGSLVSVGTLEPEVAVPKGGWKSAAAMASSVAEAAKEYSLKIKRRIAVGVDAVKGNMIEIKYGDVIDNLGLPEYNPDTKQEVRAKLSVYDEMDPTGKNCTTFKVDKQGNVYVRQMYGLGTSVGGVGVGTGATKFTIIGLMATLWLQFQNMITYITKDKKEYIYGNDLTYVGETQTTICMNKKDVVLKDAKYLVSKNWQVTATKAYIKAMKVQLGMGGYQKLVNESFLTMLFNMHTHGGVYPGPSQTAPPTQPGVVCVHTTIATEAG